MNKAQAMQAFWSGFEIPAYDENTVPTGSQAPSFPYITYYYADDSFGNTVALTASVWDRSTSWERSVGKATEIAQAIGMGGKIIPFEGGAIWIQRGSPFTQRRADDNDDMIRRVYLNISAEYISQN